jgi:hypothetical protein
MKQVQLLRVRFNGRHKTGHLDLEVIELATRSAMHRAGAAALTELPQFPAPAAGQRAIPCPCGYQAHCRELRSKPVLTAVGPVEVSRLHYQQSGMFWTVRGAKAILAPRCRQFNGRFEKKGRGPE